jgi:hypothetical protein
MAIHEKLTRIPKHDLQQMGWNKATELVKVARKDGDNSRAALHQMVLHRAVKMHCVNQYLHEGLADLDQDSLHGIDHFL